MAFLFSPSLPSATFYWSWGLRWQCKATLILIKQCWVIGLFVCVCESSLVLVTSVGSLRVKQNKLGLWFSNLFFTLTYLFKEEKMALSSACRLFLWVTLLVLKCEHLTRVNRVHSYLSELVKPISLTRISPLASSHPSWNKLLQKPVNLWLLLEHLKKGITLAFI